MPWRAGLPHHPLCCKCLPAGAETCWPTPPSIATGTFGCASACLKVGRCGFGVLTLCWVFECARARGGLHAHPFACIHTYACCFLLVDGRGPARPKAYTCVCVRSPECCTCCSCQLERSLCPAMLPLQSWPWRCTLPAWRCCTRREHFRVARPPSPSVPPCCSAVLASALRATGLALLLAAALRPSAAAHLLDPPSAPAPSATGAPVSGMEWAWVLMVRQLSALLVVAHAGSLWVFGWLAGQALLGIVLTEPCRCVRICVAVCMCMRGCVSRLHVVASIICGRA